MKVQKTPVERCTTLKQYRDENLFVPQTEIARLAKCSQPHVSDVEHGELPPKKSREGLLHAYKLSEENFVRLVIGGRFHHPIPPLMGSAQSERPAELLPLDPPQHDQARRVAQ